MEEWDKDPSRKLDVLAEILKWHLAKDGQPPLKVVKDKLKPSKTPHSTSAAEGAAPDKAIVYDEFPGSFVQMAQVGSLPDSPSCCHSPHHQVLKLHGIEVLELHGDIPAPQRSNIIQKFKTSTRDGPRVLLMSNVGLLGHNFPFANVLVKVVRCVPSASHIHSHPFPDTQLVRTG